MTWLTHEKMFNVILRKQFLIYIFAAFKGDKRQFEVFYYGFEAVATPPDRIASKANSGGSSILFFKAKK